MKLKELIEAKGWVGWATPQSKGRNLKLNWPHASKGRSFAKKKWKDGVTEHRLDILTSNDPILLKSKVDVHRISKTLPKVVQQAEMKRNSVFCTSA